MGGVGAQAGFFVEFTQGGAGEGGGRRRAFGAIARKAGVAGGVQQGIGALVIVRVHAAAGKDVF
jgi:hypothetical protein